MKSTMFRGLFCAFVLSITATGCTSEVTSDLEEEVVAEADQAINPSKIIAYQAGKTVPANQLSSVDPALYGAEPLDCDVNFRARIDLAEGTLEGGVLQASKGSYRHVFPGVFHASILVGSLKARIGGQTYNLKQGDTFLGSKGTDVEFETTSNKFQASFFVNFASPDLPGVFKVYKKGSVPAEEDLISLGTPADFNMVVLEGDPVFKARIDYYQGLESAGHFRVTRTKLFVQSTTVTEHGTVTKGSMTLTKPDGTSYTLNEGDSYLNRAQSTQTWQVNSSTVNQAFFGVFSP